MSGPAPLVTLVARGNDEDIWIQLKATEDRWVLSKLLRENLLANFICNAIQSQLCGRTWQASLVSPARVDRLTILDFLAHPGTHPHSLKALEQCVSRASARLQEARVSGISNAALHEVGRAVLAQLAEVQPVPLSTLRAEVECELAYAYPYPGAVRSLADLLLGAMLHKVAKGPSLGRPYDAEWMENAARRPLRRLGALDHNPIVACANACRRSSGLGSAARCRAPPLHGYRDAFLNAPEPLLVVTGSDRIGKSWVMADCALRMLDGQVRLLVRDLDLSSSASLARVVADQLQTETTADWRDDVFLRKLDAAASSLPPILLIDGLVVPDLLALRLLLRVSAGSCGNAQSGAGR